MGFQIKELAEKFHNLPLWGKVVLAGGAGLGLYYLVGKRISTSSDTATASSTGEGVVYYPASQESTAGSSGSSGSSMDGGGYVTSEQFAEWNNAVMDSIASVAEKQVYPTDTLSAGGKTSVAFNTGVTKLSGSEGDDDYKAKIYADGSKEIYKNGRLVPEENYKYIPQEYGGTRTTGSGLGSGSTNTTVKVDPNKALQQAQAAYGAAKTVAEKQTAAAAGAAARKSGATDAGAATVWKSTQQSISTTKADPNKALQQAQAAYGAAKTAADRNAAAAAGAAARAAGATDAGAAAAWKNK